MSALLGDDARIVSTPNDDAALALRELDIAEIIPNPHQPRQSIEDEALQELADSIREKGVIQPILVRRHPKEEGKFQIIAGERRFQASRLIGLSSIPAIVQEATDEELLELALIENIQREDLDPIEEAFAYAALQNTFGLTHEQIAVRVGKARTTVTNTLRLLELHDDIQEFLRDRRLSPGHARALLSLDDPEEQLKAANHVMLKRLNVRQTEDYVRQLLIADSAEDEPKKRGKARRPERKTAPSLQPLCDELQSILGTRVNIVFGEDGKGTIEIEFYSDDQLADLVDLLKQR